MVELRLAEEDRRKSEKNMLQWHFVHHESHKKSQGTEPGAPQ